MSKKKESPLIVFDGTPLSLDDIALSIVGNAISVSSQNREITGSLYFKGEAEAATALDEIRAGRVSLIASKDYIDREPYPPDERAAIWKRIDAMGFIGIDWNFYGHNRSWGSKTAQP